ncbi:hypothetical protein RV18_GL000612 [Enterococcus termitis]|nr:hypothetical protein RV18_GL000612 [Enterococcus termitis]
MNNAVSQIHSGLQSAKEGANELINCTELDSTSWRTTKNYFQAYPVVSDGIWNSTATLAETLTAYLSAFQAEVGAPRNQLNTDELEDLQSRLQSIQRARSDLLSEMAGESNYELNTLSNRLSSLDSASNYFVKEIKLLEDYRNFESGHANDFSGIHGTIGELKTALAQLGTQKHFNPVSGYAPRNYKNMSWFNKLSEFNAQQPETRIFKVTMKSPGGTYTTFNVYKNGKYDLGMSEKLTWLHAQQGITDLINLLGEISPVYDGVRFFVGVDPVTGKKISLEEWLQAGFWTALEGLSGAKLLAMFKNIKLNKKLLDGVSLTQKDLELFNKLGDLGDFKVAGKTGEMKSAEIISDGSHYVDGKLKPNVVYMTGEYKYLYETDNLGRIINANAEELKWKSHEGRLPHNPNTAEKLPDDHAGHLFADMFGGSPELDNLISQAKDINKKDFYRLEMQWKKALENGQKVSVDIKINYTGTSKRPTSFEVSYTIDGADYYKKLNNTNG